MKKKKEKNEKKKIMLRKCSRNGFGLLPICIVKKKNCIVREGNCIARWSAVG